MATKQPPAHVGKFPPPPPLETKSLKERLDEMHQRYYRALREHDPVLYRNCVQSAEAVALTFRLPLNIASAVEWAIIGQVCQALKIEPDMKDVTG